MRCLVLILFALIASQALPAVGPDLLAVCRDLCPDDDEQGRCAPNCSDCAHCPGPRLIEPQDRQGVFLAPTRHAAPMGMDLAPPAADPGEIQHVPRAPAA